MQISFLSLGHRPEAWVQTALEDYLRRLPSDWKIQHKNLKAEPRTANTSVETLLQKEATRIEEAIPQGAYVVVLDEHGKALSSKHLALALSEWMQMKHHVCIVIGSADGLHATIKARANLLWSLSPLTLPHALVRVLLAESLYRAWSITVGHPYHRE